MDLKIVTGPKIGVVPLMGTRLGQEASMAHIWHQDEAKGGWRVYPLESASGGGVVVEDGVAEISWHRSDNAGDGVWVLEAAESVRVNGESLLIPFRVLEERDEIVLPSGRLLYFSKEGRARVTPLPHGTVEVCCARCRQPIAVGSPSVACPACGAYHHQADDLPCWTYAPRCSLCDQPTALDADYHFTPEAL